MDPKDTSPFGYNFNAEFFPNNGFPNGDPILDENETQYVDDFFNSTPFLSDTNNNSLPQPVDAKNSLNTSLNSLDWSFPPPPTIHGVSTTISDQAQLHNNFDNDHNYGSDPFIGAQFAPTQDEFQAASTLFNAHVPSHPPVPQQRSYSFHDAPPTTHDPPPTDARKHSVTTAGYDPRRPTVVTAHGPMTEQLAAMLPNHSENGSIDAAIAAEISQVSPVHHQQLAQIADVHRPQLKKRSYTYGTDNAFNEGGFTVKSLNETEEAVTRRLMYHLEGATLAMDEAAGKTTRKLSLNSPAKKPAASRRHSPPESDDGAGSDDGSAANDEPAKKRRKESYASPSEKASRPSISGASAKGRKASADGTSKKKRNPGEKKQHRENLTEEQKRNNHIQSEQKRRNLIKRGFEDLNELVPELRNGGLSKSTVLIETVAFLEKLLNDNQRYKEIVRAQNG